MLFHVTFVYEADVVPPRKRNSVSRPFLATVPVEVEEVASADLPVAFRFDEKRFWDKGLGVLREIRWAEGRGHWQEDLDIPDRDDAEPGERPPAHRRDADWLSAHADARGDAVDGGGGNDPFRTLTYRIGDADKLAPIEGDPQVAKIRSWDREEREAAVRAAAANMILVDGVLHERTSEPVYNLRQTRSLSSDRTWIEIDRADGYEVKGRTHFRADEREGMLRRAGIDGEASAIEVLIPDAVRAPLPERELAECAELVANRLGNELKDNDRAFFSAYADVRDALASFKAALDAADTLRDAPPPAAELVAALLASQASTRLSAGGRHGYVEEAVEAACARYDERSLALEDAFGFAP